MTCGATCPCCLRFFWTSARLQQHLAYIPRKGGVNRCFQTLTDRGFQGEYTAVHVSQAVKGTIRLDSLPTAGPQQMLMNVRDRQRAEVQAEIASLEEELIIPVLPEDHLRVGQELAQRLTSCTQIWIEKFRGCDRADVPIVELGDWWMRLLFAFDACFEPWTELVFLSWGQHVLPDILAAAIDGDIEIAIEEAFYELYKVLPRTECLDRIAFLRQKLDNINRAEAAAPLPHRSRKIGTANTAERQRTTQLVPSAYESQADWLNVLRQVQWVVLPIEMKLPIYKDL